MRLIALLLLAASAGFASLCDVTQFKRQSGINIQQDAKSLTVTWTGERNEPLRVVFAIDNGQPVIRELGAGKSTLGRDLRPEYRVTSGLRRISNQQLAPLRELKIDITADVIEREKWNVFWDAPLQIPGSPNTNPGLPRKPEEVRRAEASFQTTSCSVKSNGARLEISFNGLEMGIFAGTLQYTVYSGSNLLRQEAIAKTDEPSVAYKYECGLKGFKPGRVAWRDVASQWQKYEFGGAVNKDPVALRARNRIAVVEGQSGSLAVFPPPHKFFFAREIELNLGYVYYRKDSDASFAAGVRHGDYEEMYRPHGRTEEQYRKRERQSRNFAQGNFALYNAPPGTWQHMAVYFYLSPQAAQPTLDRVLAYTHDDKYKSLPGHQVAISHFHTHFHEFLSDAGTIDAQPSWVPTFRALGVNIAMMSDFHSDGHPNDEGAVRFKEQQVYFEGCRRHSDRDFLIMPGEEPDAFFGGHYTMVLPKPVYWSHVRKQGQSFQETHPDYGSVYHVGSAEEELDMLKREGGLVWQAHPRTKGSTYYPDAIRETPYFRSDLYLGASYQSLPVDMSQPRICEARCFGVLDDMNNWGGPKYLLAEGDTYAKFPDDDTYSHLLVNYIKLDRVPKFDEDWSPVLKALRSGDFFVTSGEVLIRKFAIENQRTAVAEVEWTFPLEFVELVWSDGQKVDRQMINAADRKPFGSETFRIPFDPAGKKWIRLAVWDSAGNGAFVNPVHLR